MTTHSTKIKSIKKIGVVDTYDIMTPTYHNFFLENGILSHNSTGNGKSWGSLAMAEKYAQQFGIEFNPEYHVINSLKELLKLITAADVDKKIKVGSVLLFDEPQVEGNARNWNSEMNQAFSQLISTFRNQRLVVFFATPYLSGLDKQSRILFHADFKILGFDRNNGITSIKPRFLEWNKDKEVFYSKRLLVSYPAKGKKVYEHVKLDTWSIPKASKITLDTYEGKKKKFTDDLNLKLLKKIEMSEKQTESVDKYAEILKVKELYLEFGDDYLKILEQMPRLTPFSLDHYLRFIKKSLGLSKNRQKT